MDSGREKVGGTNDVQKGSDSAKNCGKIMSSEKFIIIIVNSCHYLN